MVFEGVDGMFDTDEFEGLMGVGDTSEEVVFGVVIVGGTKVELDKVTVHEQPSEPLSAYSSKLSLGNIVYQLRSLQS